MQRHTERWSCVPRTRNNSVGSADSSLNSCSSDASVESYEKNLKPGIEAIKYSGTSLQELVGEAEKTINEKFTPDSRSVFKDTKKNISIGLDNVMLACAEECGGEVWKCYVASAILTCSKEDDMMGALAALGTTWLTHLLFIYHLSMNSIEYLFKLKQARATETGPTKIRLSVALQLVI